MATIRLTQDFREFLLLLNSEKIEYLLIGGYAVGLYGYLRPTKDIDLWVAVDPASQQRLADALIKFGFPGSAVQQPLFTPEKTVLRMGLPPNRLELITNIAGVDFAECFRRRQMLDVDGLIIPVIAYDDLLCNKRSAGREQDRVDVERLEQRKPKS